ncbi:MAG TPA: hypothetical protein VI504_10930 [Candidatus Eisenbacteria bacterium]
MSTQISIYERDAWIVRYLQDAPEDKRTIRDIWEHAKDSAHVEDESGVVQPRGIGDTATLPTYHRTVAKLVARGFLLSDGSTDGAAARYTVAPRVSPLTPLSQPDLNQALWELGPTTALAYYVDTVEQFEGRSAAVMRQAAEGLLQEEPRELILRMLKDIAHRLDEDVADVRDASIGNDEAHRQKVERQLQDFARFVHGELGINPAVWRIPDLPEIEAKPVPVDHRDVERHVGADDWTAVAAELAGHVFGPTFLHSLTVTPEPDRQPQLIIAGTDGSSHPGEVRGMPAAAYADDDRLVLWFNNGAGYVDLPPSFPGKFPSPYHGIPITRAALEDPGNKGMIISRPWFQDLDDGEFEHLRKTALDVVQYRIDEALLSGMAQPYGAHAVQGGDALPKPHVLLRDGAVSPQSRELQNYTNRTSYGEMVREGIRLSYKILRHVMDSDRRVFAGAVKSTQLRTFSRILNWYIQRGSELRFGQAIDPHWELERMGLISDSVAMTRLLCSLSPVPDRAQYYSTCVIVRPFTAMVTSLFRVHRVREPGDWRRFFEEQLAEQVKRYNHSGSGERPWFDGRDIAEDEYVRMCEYADFGMFYLGRPGGSPQIRFPRFEFLDSIRTRGAEQRSARVMHVADLIVRGVHSSKWALDQDHNIMSRRRLPRLIPFVIYEAHEKCKVLGHKLISELQQAIAANLSAMKGLRGMAVPRTTIEYVSLQRLRKQLERMAKLTVRRGEALGDAGPEPTTLPPAEQPRDVSTKDFS